MQKQCTTVENKNNNAVDKKKSRLKLAGIISKQV